jgi:hypothetical protein
MPTYKVGNRRLYVGTWKHGVSIYSWEQGRAAGFIARHPALKTCKGTIQLRPADAAPISDEEFRYLVRAALDAGSEPDSAPCPEHSMCEPSAGGSLRKSKARVKGACGRSVRDPPKPKRG